MKTIELMNKAYEWEEEEGKQRSIKIEISKRQSYFSPEGEREFRIFCFSYDVMEGFSVDVEDPVFYEDDVLKEKADNKVKEVYKRRFGKIENTILK